MIGVFPAKDILTMFMEFYIILYNFIELLEAQVSY